MSSLLEFLAIVGGTTALSILGLVLVRSRVKREKLEPGHEVGGILIAIVGTLYAILVGLVVVSAQSKVDEASSEAAAEANKLSNIYHLSGPFEPAARHKIRGELHSYAEAVVQQDWSKVEQGLEKEATVAPYRRLWSAVVEYHPRNDHEQVFYESMVDEVKDLAESRKHRMVAARNQLSPVLWGVLITGGVLIIIFTYFFFVESLLSQVIMTAFVAIFLSMNIYLIFVCQNPYRPELGAKSAGFGASFSPAWFEDKSTEEPKEALKEEQKEQPKEEKTK